MTGSGYCRTCYNDRKREKYAAERLTQDGHTVVPRAIRDQHDEVLSEKLREEAIAWGKELASGRTGPNPNWTISQRAAFNMFAEAEEARIEGMLDE